MSYTPYSVLANTKSSNRMYCTSYYLVFYWCPLLAKKTYRGEVKALLLEKLKSFKKLYFAPV